MDGAAKFVRGDAIAGLLITFINLIGGLIIGVGQMGISFGEAAESYTMLTVGDGLVSQIPALVVSTAAGLLVSKAGVTGRADKALLGAARRLPEIPRRYQRADVRARRAARPAGAALPRSSAVAAGWLAWRSSRRAAAERRALAAPPAGAGAARRGADRQALQIDPIRLELGYGLLPLISEQRRPAG